MELVVTTGAIGRAKLQSNHYHQQTNTKSLFAGQMRFLSPNQQCQSTEGKFGWDVHSECNSRCPLQGDVYTVEADRETDKETQ